MCINFIYDIFYDIMTCCGCCSSVCPRKYNGVTSDLSTEKITFVAGSEAKNKIEFYEIP